MDKTPKDGPDTCEEQAAGWAAGARKGLSSGPGGPGISQGLCTGIHPRSQASCLLSPHKCGNWGSEEPTDQITIPCAEHCPVGPGFGSPASRMAVTLPASLTLGAEVVCQ